MHAAPHLALLRTSDLPRSAQPFEHAA